MGRELRRSGGMGRLLLLLLLLLGRTGLLLGRLLLHSLHLIDSRIATSRVECQLTVQLPVKIHAIVRR